MRLLSIMTLFVSLLISGLSFAESREEIALNMINKGALLIDVRTDREYVDGHLKDAILIPHPRIVDQFANLEIRKDRQVVLYCRSGRRAGVAEAALRQAGYTNLFNGGGYQMLIGKQQ